MSASSSAASSSLTRPARTGILLVGVLAVAGIYYYYQTIADFDITASNAAATGLHRSNAVHRRRRRTHTNEEGIDTEQTESAEDPGGIIAFLEDDIQDATARPLGDGETVVDDPHDDSWSSNHWDEEGPHQRNGQNIVQLLFRVSEDATRRNAYVHRGCQCNSCGTVPIRGIRYRCSNCSDFDLCEACEAQSLHTKTHIFYKVRVPTAAFAARQMQPVWYPGDPDTCMKMLPRELITRLSKDTGFERPEIDAYWEQWTFMANTEWREDPDDLCLAMDRKTFDQCLVPSGGNRTAPNLIHDRMFAFYDQNNDDLISFPEFLDGLAYRRKKDKLKRVFEGYDINGDGFVDRKDFLRMFRSYYVLYKQMHRDMLDGLDDQVMNSTDAHQLVTSRQPLSGAFGRDGRFPPAPDPRTGEGKAAGLDGDLEVTDSKGVISESSNDCGNKEDVLIDAIVRDYYRDKQRSFAWDPERSSTYWRAVSNPPETITELQHNVLDGLIRERRGEAPQVNPLLTPPSQDPQEVNLFHESDPLELNTSLERFAEDGFWPPSFVRLEDVKAVCGEGVTFDNMQRQFRIHVLRYARERVRDMKVGDQTIAANDQIHERWKRRQFYTDEEEGGSAPPDWKDEEEISDLNGKAAENLQPISPRSRSSSKVRFADDDDYDTRSNASTSSRSIPERWGGMEIPEAEKDAGKEILYQVTQQAFNEMLDPLFQKKEDLAVAALTSKATRDKYRHLFIDPIYEHWAFEVRKALENPTEDANGNWRGTEADMRKWRAGPSVPDIELPEVRQRTLGDLLATTGYHIDPTLADAPGLDDRPATGSVPRHPDAIFDISASGGTDSLPNDETAVSQFQIDGSQQANEEEIEEAFQIAASLPEEQFTALVELYHDQSDANQAFRTSENVETESYNDPTLPQFRPNTTYPTPTPLTIPPSLSGVEPLPAIHIPRSTPDSNERFEDPDSTSRTLLLDPLHSPHLPVPERTRSRRISTTSIAENEPPFLSLGIERKPKHLDVLGSEGATNLAALSKLEATFFSTSKATALESMPKEQQKMFASVDWMALYKLREMDLAAKEAEERGGWGRIDWGEFKDSVRGEKWGDGTDRGERWKSTVHVVEYLGTWIDFCIPP